MDELKRFGGVKELPKPIEPIPEEIAVGFVNGTWLKNVPIVHEGDKTKIWRVFRRREFIPNVGDVRLILDYRKYHKNEGGKFDRLQFEYFQEDPIEPENERVIAQMHVQSIPDGSFILDHRHVHPDLRGKVGLGTRLYQQVESFMQ